MANGLTRLTAPVVFGALQYSVALTAELGGPLCV